MKFTIGCDPEVFVMKEGKLVSAHGLVQGTKAEPQPVPHGAVQVDGMALEFNTEPVTLNSYYQGLFVYKVNTVLKSLENMIKGFKLHIVPSVVFSQKDMDDAPEEAKELGCEPDFNVYTGVANPPPNANSLLRTAAGHIHIGWGDGVEDPHAAEHIVQCEMLVRNLDATLGLISLLLDKDEKRRELYGKAGAYRPKPYGVEYRVLSNFWLKGYAEFIYNTCYFVTRRLLASQAFVKPGVDYQSIINNNRKEEAADLLRMEDVMTPNYDFNWRRYL